MVFDFGFFGASGETSCCAHAGLVGWKDLWGFLIQPSGLDRRRLLNKIVDVFVLIDVLYFLIENKLFVVQIINELRLALKKLNDKFFMFEREIFSFRLAKYYFKGN